LNFIEEHHNQSGEMSPAIKLNHTDIPDFEKSANGNPEPFECNVSMVDEGEKN
jgi:hypothetical protein